MLLDAILLVIQGVLNILLLPLTALNIAVDFIGSLPVVVQFLQIVAYMLPFDNLLPLIVLLIAIFTFRIGIKLILLLLKFIPGMG